MSLSPTQLAHRRDKIGGSDVAAICGKDPYRTAFEVALRITGQIEPDKLDGLDIIEFGNEMEGVLARFYERKNKLELYQPDTIIHPKYPFLIANVDRRVNGIPAIGIECKNTGVTRAMNVPVVELWGKPGTDEVPERVLLQVAHYMMCEPELQFFHVLRCYGGNVYQQFMIPRNEALIESLLEIELGFYYQVTVGGVIPEPDWAHRSTSDALRRAFKKMEGVIEARPDLVTWTTVYEEAKASLKEATVLEASLKNRIVHMMGDTEIAVLPDGRKWVRRLIKKNGFTVEPTEYIETRIVKPRAKKGVTDGASEDSSE